jgi:TRAP-type C4-dicarboxylate transport system permease small subunit
MWRTFWRVLSELPSVVGVYTGGISLLTMTVIIIVEVVCREFFHVSTLLSDELSGYLVVVLTFLGAGHTLRKDAHISFDTLYNAMPPTAQRVMRFVADLISLVIVGALAWGAGIMWWNTFSIGARSTTPLAVPLALPQSAMTLGLALITLELIFRLVSPKMRKN